MTNILILGGGYAGTLAALRLAGRLRGTAAHITLINGTADFVERIRLHQLAAGQPLRAQPLAKLLAGTGIQLVQGWVTQLDVAQRRVHLADGQTLPYDYLLYALGSTTAVDRTPGVADHAHTLASPHAAVNLHTALAHAAASASPVLVVGGGATGIELAAELAEQYPTLPLTLATQGTWAADLHPHAADYLRRHFAQHHIAVREQVTISHLTAGMAHTAVGQPIPFGVCVWAASFSVPAMAQQAGLAVDAQGRVLVDGSLRAVHHPEIYVVGDGAATGLRMACATAMPQGAYAADHLAAVVRHTAVPAPFRFAYVARCLSLGRRAGLVQVVNAADVPQRRFFTGRRGAWIKELICRFTIWSFWLEKRFPGSYRWAQGGKAAVRQPQLA